MSERRGSTVAFPSLRPRLGWRELATTLTARDATARFEAALRALTGAGGATLAPSGTAALAALLGGASRGVPRGEPIYFPAWTSTAVPEAIRAVGREPFPVDVDPRTLGISPAALSVALARRPGDVVHVWPFGRPLASEPIATAVAACDTRWVLDAAHTLSVSSVFRDVDDLRGRRLGVMVSFGFGKALPIGGGGVALYPVSRGARGSSVACCPLCDAVGTVRLVLRRVGAGLVSGRRFRGLAARVLRGFRSRNREGGLRAALSLPALARLGLALLPNHGAVTAYRERLLALAADRFRFDPAPFGSPVGLPLLYRDAAEAARAARLVTAFGFEARGPYRPFPGTEGFEGVRTFLEHGVLLPLRVERGFRALLERLPDPDGLA